LSGAGSPHLEVDYLTIIEKKAPSMRRPAPSAGFWVTGGGGLVVALRRFGFPGMAFQMTDDTLDYMAERPLRQKRRRTSWREKLTLPLIAPGRCPKRCADGYRPCEEMKRSGGADGRGSGYSG
jgi:hypothetical protein